MLSLFVVKPNSQIPMMTPQSGLHNCDCGKCVFVYYERKWKSV